MIYAILLIALFSIPAAAHVPLTPSPGNNLSSAVLVPDPEKTFAIYGALHYPGEADYYRLELNANQMLELQLSVPDPSFMPSLVVMGPGIGTKDYPPDRIRAPEGSGVIVLPGIKPENAWYEPFSPMSIYQVSNYSLLQARLEVIMSPFIRRINPELTHWQQVRSRSSARANGLWCLWT